MKNKRKRMPERLFAVLLALCMIVSWPGISSLAAETANTGEADVQTAAQDSSSSSNPYEFKSQLKTDNELEFYRILESMLNDTNSGGSFKKGEAKIAAKINEDDLAAYLAGNALLAQQFQNARDAFAYDHSELFYVDWAKISLRVGTSNGTSAAYVGNGAYKDFYIESGAYRSETAINKALLAINAKVDKIVGEAEKLTDEVDQIRYAHDKIIELTTYNLQNGKNDYYVANIAGVFLKEEALCEGYSRSFKMLMDKMKIPCVLVVGGGLPESATNIDGTIIYSPDATEHMWNYVQLKSEKWYAVDVTYDDPIIYSADAYDRSSLTSTTKDEFFLKGSDSFKVRHAEGHQFSQGGMNFNYPEISETDWGQSKDSNLTVEMSYRDEETENGDLISVSDFTPVYTDKSGVRYKGKELDKAELDGAKLYWAYRPIVKSSEAEGETKAGAWYDPTAYPTFPELGFIEIFNSDASNPIIAYEFAVTATKPVNGLTPWPNGNDIVEISEAAPVRNVYVGDWKPQPWIIESVPSSTEAFIEKSTKVKLVYDTPLKLADGYTEASLSVETDFSGPNYRAENLTWKNEIRNVLETEKECCTIEFDFYPDTSYNYAGISYAFVLNGLVSTVNGTAPHTKHLVWQGADINKIPCPKLPAPSSMILSTLPRLVKNSFSEDMFADPSGNLINPGEGNLNISLIASKPASEEQKKIDAALGVTPAGESATYDLSIGCRNFRAYLATLSGTGCKMSIALPYPKGFDSRNMEGVTFEAYHFGKDENGNYVKKKLVCNATDTGIWIIADEFSPFTVVPVLNENHDSNGERYISAVTDPAMAEVTVEKSPSTTETLLPEIVTLKAGESCTYHFTPKDGYEMEQAVWNGDSDVLPTKNSDGTYSFTFKYEDLEAENNSLIANFCAAAVKDAEEQAKITAVNPVITSGTSVTSTVPKQNDGQTEYSESKMTAGGVVTAPIKNDSSIQLNYNNLTIQTGSSKELTVSGVSDGSTVAWKSSMEAVATVDTNGQVKGLSSGTSYISAAVGTDIVTCKVEVTEKSTVEVSSVTLNKETLNLNVGDSSELTATVNPDDATNKSVIWNNSAPDVVKMENGKVIALKKGTAKITAAAGGKSAACTVTVSEVPVTSIELDQTALALKAGQEETLTATVKPDNATDKTVTWNSSDKTVATVDNGKVKALKGGTADITAEAGGITSTACTVTVSEVPVISVELDQSTLALKAGQEGTLTATVKPDNATDKTVTWSSSDKTVAAVDNGRVKALKEGTATITAAAGGKSAACTVTVSKAAVSVVFVGLDKTSLDLEVGKEGTLTATVQPSNATNKTVTWSSSDGAVATVDNGKVKALKEGTATITAAAGGKSAACTVTVSKAAVAVTSVELDQTALALEVGKEGTLTATVKPDNATDKTVTWSSSDEAVATVDNGKVKALKGGTATITAAAGGKSAACTVTVSKAAVAVTSVELDQTALALEVGKEGTLTATVKPDNATNKTVTWSSSDEAVATVDNGKVKALKEGTATITAAAGGKSAACVVTVTEEEKPLAISYSAHIQNIGWDDYVENGQPAGTVGKGRRLEAVRIKLENSKVSGSIQYRTQIQDIGWQQFVSDDQVSGTEGKGKRLEAIQIQLTGEMAEQYDVYYRVHIENYGWLDWAANGASAGSEGMSLRMEAMEIQLAEKGQAAPGSTDRPFVTSKPVKPVLTYESQVQNVGWTDAVGEGEVSGTVGASLRMESIRLNLEGLEGIEYRTHVQNIGWEDSWAANGEIAGTVGSSLRMEAIQVRLTNEMAEKYDIYYQVHAQNFGWLGWAKNGEIAGTQGYGLRLEGIRIVLVEKGQPAPQKNSELNCFYGV